MTTILPPWLATTADWLCDWILYLPRDLALCCVALLMALLFALARKWLTNQEWLHRAATDRQRQRQLRREAVHRQDTEAIRRHAAVLLRIRRQAVRRTILPILMALLPVALLGLWAFTHLAYQPPRLQEAVEVRARFPHAAIGQMAHLAPAPGIMSVNGWIQHVGVAKPVAPVNTWDRVGAWLGDQGRAIWQLLPIAHATPAAAPGEAIWRVLALDAQPHLLLVRYAGRTYEVPFRAGTHHPEVPLQLFPGAPLPAIEVALKPMYLFDRIGGLPCIGLPAWLLTCLLLTPPLVSFLRKLLRIA
jgi:hypothetical protein